MRKLTPEERLEKQLAREAHIHSADCGHEVVAEPVAEEVVAEPVVAEAPAEESPAEEAVAESKPKKKSTPKY